MLTDAITQFVTHYLDPRDLLAWLLVFMGFDIATGVIASLKEGRINSSIAWKGVWKKAATVMALLFVIVAMPFVSAYGGGFDPHIDVAVTIGFVLVEFASIVENLARCGVKTDFLSRYFEKVGAPKP